MVISAQHRGVPCRLLCSDASLLYASVLLFTFYCFFCCLCFPQRPFPCVCVCVCVCVLIFSNNQDVKLWKPLSMSWPHWVIWPLRTIVKAQKTKEILFLLWILYSSCLIFIYINHKSNMFSYSLWEHTDHSVFVLLNYVKLFQVLCVYLFQSQEELQEYCRHHEITYVALVSDKEGSHVKVKTRGNLSQFNNQISQTVLTMERPTFPLRSWPWPWVETHYFILLLNC